MREKKYCSCIGEVSVLPPVLPTLPHISARKTASVTGKNFNSQSVCDENKSPRPSALLDRDFRELSPRKQPPSPLVRESDSIQFTDGDYVIKCEKCNFITFQDVWWVRISITTYYNSIHLLINWPRV